MDATLQFWVDCSCEDRPYENTKRTRTQLIAEILREYERSGDAMRHLNAKGQIAWKASPWMVDEDRYVAIITDGKGDIPNGTKIPVPNHKLKWDQGNPTVHGIIFIGLQGQVYCYIVPGGV
jgi:hypothetical protein